MGIIISVDKINIEPQQYKILLDIEGVSNKEIVQQIGVGELIAEMEIKDIMNNLDITDILDTFTDFETIKTYLRNIDEI